MKNALRVVLSLLVASPAGAGLPLATGETQAALQGAADLGENARLAASLEQGTHATGRLFDQTASRPLAMAAGSTAQPKELQPPAAETGVKFPGVPPVTADKADTSAAEAEAKAKKAKLDLKRDAIGGIGGAIVLGVFGFIFGGPIGAIAMGALGFGLLAGVTHLNNNPIK